MLRSPLRLAALAAALLLLPITAVAETREVPGEIPTLAGALGVSAAGDTIVVACGTYYWSDLVMPSGVVLRSETGLPDCVTLDAQGSSGHLYMAGLDSMAVVEGITFLDGWGSYSGVSGMFGGAIRMTGSRVRLSHCDFLENDAVYGGALYVSGSWLQMESCRFEQNTATGDGAVTLSSSTATVVSCAFVDNWAFEGAGAIWSANGSSLTVTDSEFLDNTTTEEAGGIISHSNCWLRAERSLFEGNTSDFTAGAVAVTWGELTDCTFRQNVTQDSGGAVSAADAGVSVRGCVFEGNVAAGYGGALRGWHLYSGPGLSVSVEGCTFHANEAALYGSALAATGGIVFELDRCLLAFGLRGGAVYVDAESSVHASCTDIYGNADGDWAGPMAAQLGVEGNISADPLFCDAAAGNLTLRDWSPCLAEYSPCGQQIGALGMGCPAVDAPPILARTQLLPNHPNPFNPRTTIPYRLSRAGHVRLTVHDLRGRLVATLLDAPCPSGPGETAWEGTDALGRAVASGVYVVRLVADGQSWQQKVALVR